MISKQAKKNTTKKVRAKPTTSTVYIYREYGSIRASSNVNDLPAGVRFVKVTMPYGALNGPVSRKCVGEIALTPNEAA